MHPIIVINMRKLIDSGKEITEEGVDLLTYYVQEIGLEEGIAEKWHIIIDFKDVSTWEVPVT